MRDMHGIEIVDGSILAGDNYRWFYKVFKRADGELIVWGMNVKSAASLEKFNLDTVEVIGDLNERHRHKV